MPVKERPKKHILKSKTVNASLISLISYGILFFSSKNIHDKYFSLVGILGVISNLIAIYGRYIAKEELYIFKKKGK